MRARERVDSMGGSARIVNVYFTTEEMDAINAVCKKTTQTPQAVIKKSVMRLLKEIDKSTRVIESKS